MGVLLAVLAMTVTFLLVVAIGLVIMLNDERKRANTADARADEKVHNAIMAFGIKYKEAEKKLRADAIKRSTAVVRGKVAEHLVPFSIDFGFNPRDARFLGSPIDFVVFDGLTEGHLERVVLVEVKTGQSAHLSQREKQVQNAIEEGEVDFEILHVGGNK